MPARNQAALDYLASRRSIPAKTFTGRVPHREELLEILTLALRVPDHGKLEPWRLVVIDRPAFARLANLAQTRAEELGGEPEKIAKGRGQYDLGHLAVAVISAPKASEKVPAAEQVLSAGALCMNIVHAASAAGWSACWLSGWPAHDAPFCARAFGCAETETVAGIIHIGTAASEDAPDRPRPIPDRLITWAKP
jgi:nitroreductase